METEQNPSLATTNVVGFEADARHDTLQKRKADAQHFQELPPGKTRLSREELQAFETLGYGMFLHFGMSTFDGDEYSVGDKPTTCYAPEKLDVKQWVSAARDAGMKYAVLTAKHTSGFCLWPSMFTDYHVGNASNTTDVIGEFVRACQECGIAPGFYYCAWDNHHRFGSITPSMVPLAQAWTSGKYQELLWQQVEELLTSYGNFRQVWLDIPGVLPREFRNRLYRHISELQPQTLITTNSAMDERMIYDVGYSWPADVAVIERSLPHPYRGRKEWEIEGRRYYMPLEMCDTISREWFYTDDDAPFSDATLLSRYLVCRSMGANYLLNVPPDRSGRLPQMHIDALMRLQKNIEKCGVLSAK